MSESRQHTSRRTRKIAAIAAGLLVVGVGATYTLASWTDSEWVWGGTNEGNPGIGTSSFAIDQRHTDTADWLNRPAPEGEPLAFSGTPLSLTPGDTIYAPVTIATVLGSIAGEVELLAADNVDLPGVEDDQDELWNALEVRAFTSKDGDLPTCDATTVGTPTWTQLTNVKSLNTAAGVKQELEANRESLQHYCFELTLPTEGTNHLQGRTIAPAWEFAAVSN